jgi:hypothetical protein
VPDARRLILAAALLAVTVAACRAEKPLPPAEDTAAPAAGPSATLRPLTSRDGAAAAPEAAPSPAPEGSLPPGHPPLDTAPAGHAASAGSVSGTITVTPNLQSRAKGGVLFVIARSGPDRRIVAVRRESAAAFPFAFRISGMDAMIAGTSFTGPLEITARLSQTGDAVASKGDVEGVAKGVAVGATDVKITLDTVHE